MLSKLKQKYQFSYYQFNVINIYIYIYMGMCFFDVAVPGGWYKGYESQVWFGVWLGRYDSGYGSRASELLLCDFGRCKAPVRWQLDRRENLDRLVAISQPGALLREWVIESCYARWKAQSHCLRRTSWPPPLGVQATRVLTNPSKRCLRGSAAAQSGPPPAPVTNQRKGKTT